MQDRANTREQISFLVTYSFIIQASDANRCPESKPNHNSNYNPYSNFDS